MSEPTNRDEGCRMKFETRKCYRGTYIGDWKRDFREFLGLTDADVRGSSSGIPCPMTVKHIGRDVYVSNAFLVKENCRMLVARGFGYTPEEAERNAERNAARIVKE